MPSPIAIGQPVLTAFLAQLFHQWHEAGVPFLVLRNYETLPHVIPGDVDILVDPEFLPQAEADLIACARAHGLKLVNRVWFSPLALFFADPQTGAQIHVDLFKHLVWRGVPLIDVRQALARRQDYKEEFFIPHPVDEMTVSLLTRLLYSGKVKETYRDSIQAVFREKEAECLAALQSVLGNHAAGLTEKILAGSWDAIAAQANAFRAAAQFRELRRRPLSWLASLGSDLRRVIGRLCHPPGLLIVLLGPDGAGKSTLMEGLQAHLATTFSLEKNLYVHWKPTLKDKKRQDRTAVTNPHGQSPRSLPASVAYLIFHWLGFIAGGWLVIRPILFRNGMVIVDRYFHDLQADPRRYRLHHHTPGIRLLLRFLARPDLIFVLDAPAELLQSRKAEVSLEESARQRSDYLQIARAYPQAHVVDASQAAEQVSEQASRITLDFLARRSSAQ